MEVKVKDKSYEIRFTSRIGAYYTYEVEFGTSFEDDLQIMSFRNAVVKLVWALIKTDNDVVDITFKDLLADMDDSQWQSVFEYIATRLKATTPSVQTEEGEESKNA